MIKERRKKYGCVFVKAIVRRKFVAECATVLLPADEKSCLPAENLERYRLQVSNELKTWREHCQRFRIPLESLMAPLLWWKSRYVWRSFKTCIKKLRRYDSGASVYNRFSFITHSMTPVVVHIYIDNLRFIPEREQNLIYLLCSYLWSRVGSIDIERRCTIISLNNNITGIYNLKKPVNFSLFIEFIMLYTWRKTTSCYIYTDTISLIFYKMF